jgi:hypothetical protein
LPAACNKCDAIDLAIARYRRLKTLVLDQQMNDAADHLLEKLAVEKLALHPKE